MDDQERQKRLKMAQLVAKEFAKRDQTRKLNQNQTQTKKEDGKLRFWISEDESKQLDNMTVRALAENPEAARAFFDQYGVFLREEDGQIIETRDYAVIENSTLTTSWPDIDENSLGFNWDARY
ncbi:MAG: hypothetical protein ONB46_15480 [candidate division KSB1 bacterium]|nr:hypothetical protein [candidate division KSB1 bacterium]MDZ7367118.1 hypothetical protein [candidate division KSB1 bacterium]MDZ7405096.1 hypothetical protein [candidate division KSB1 bacterium]